MHQDNNPYTPVSAATVKPLQRPSYIRVNALLLVVILCIPILAYLPNLIEIWTAPDLNNAYYNAYNVTEHYFSIRPLPLALLLLVYFGLPNWWVYLGRRRF